MIACEARLSMEFSALSVFLDACENGVRAKKQRSGLLCFFTLTPFRVRQKMWKIGFLVQKTPQKRLLRRLYLMMTMATVRTHVAYIVILVADHSCILYFEGDRILGILLLESHFAKVHVQLWVLILANNEFSVPVENNHLVS